LEKGINLQIDELKKNLADVINKSNMPIYVTKMILTEMLNEVIMVTNKVIEEEDKAYQEGLKESNKQDIKQ
jgi:uncharacterized protein YejL (UPF0352 family)